MSSFKNKVKIKATVLKETTGALLVDIDGGQHWIPKSQIDDDSEVYKEDDTGELIISEWIAAQKGIEP